MIDKCCTKLNSRRQPSQQKFEETTELQRTVAIKSSVSENMDGILDKEGISNEGLYTGIKTCALFIMHFSFWFQALLKLTKGVKKRVLFGTTGPHTEQNRLPCRLNINEEEIQVI